MQMRFWTSAGAIVGGDFRNVGVGCTYFAYGMDMNFGEPEGRMR